MLGLLRRKGEIWIPRQRRNAARTACAVRTTRSCVRSVRECGGTRRKGRLFIAKEKLRFIPEPFHLCLAHGNALSDVGALFRFIHHDGGVVGVAHAALAPAVDRQFFAADQDTGPFSRRPPENPRRGSRRSSARRCASAVLRGLCPWRRPAVSSRPGMRGCP